MADRWGWPPWMLAQVMSTQDLLELAAEYRLQDREAEERGVEQRVGAELDRRLARRGVGRAT